LAARDSQDVTLVITQTSQTAVRDSQDVSLSADSPTTALVRNSQDITISPAKPTTANVRVSQDIALYLVKIHGAYDSQDVTLVPTGGGTGAPTSARVSQDLTLFVIPTSEANVVTVCGAGAGFMPALSYYLNLLTSEYQNATRLKTWLKSLLLPMIQLGNLFGCLSVRYFDLDQAAGAQLDILGQIVGAGRTVNFQPSGGVSPTLDDTTYRVLLKAKIAQNQWDGKIASLYPLWTIILSGAFTSIFQDLIEQGLIVPRPEGVEYAYSFPVLPAFGFDSSPGYIAGFDEGHWA
jgi:hypothetical protein